MGTLFGAGELTPIALDYPWHPITKDFKLMTLHHMAGRMEAGKGTIEGVSAQNLVQTSPQSWADTDLALKDPIRFEEGKDRQGPDAPAAGGDGRAPLPPPSAPRPPAPPPP